MVLQSQPPHEIVNLLLSLIKTISPRHRPLPRSGRVAPLAQQRFSAPRCICPVHPSFRALSGRLKFTVRRHELNRDSLVRPKGVGWGESGTETLYPKFSTLYPKPYTLCHTPCTLPRESASQRQGAFTGSYSEVPVHLSVGP